MLVLQNNPTSEWPSDAPHERVRTVADALADGVAQVIECSACLATCKRDGVRQSQIREVSPRWVPAYADAWGSRPGYWEAQWHGYYADRLLVTGRLEPICFLSGI